MDYIPHLRRQLTQPIIDEGQEGVSQVIDTLDNYNLLKEDFDSLLEVGQWPNRQDPWKQIDSKVGGDLIRLD